MTQGTTMGSHLRHSAATSPIASQAAGKALVIIDGVVEDIATADGRRGRGRPGGRTASPGGGGLAYLAAEPKREQGLSTLHLVSHDEPSLLRLGATMLPLV